MNLKLNIRVENIRYCYKSTSDFKKGYYPKPNIVKDEKGDLVNTPTKPFPSVTEYTWG